MQVYPGFVYLDLRKTGSTFVIRFLREFAKDKALQSSKHACVEECDPDKFYFITYRDPLDQYLSLYSFGCKGRGQTHGIMKQLGRYEEFYDRTARGFSAWLNFLLEPGNPAMGMGAKNPISAIVGFQTYRLLAMSLLTPRKLLASCRSKNELRGLFRQECIWDEGIETAHLNAGLQRLARGPLAPHLKDVDEAAEFLANAHKVNTSLRVDSIPGFEISERDKRLIAEREWLFFEELGLRRYSHGEADDF